MYKLPISIKDMTREQLRAYHREKQKGYRQGGVKRMPRSAEYKFCTVCERELPRTTDYFYRSKQNGYYSSRCKECNKVRFKKMRVAYKPKWRPLGLTVEQYNKLLDGAACAICNEEDRKKLVLDHCHTQNKIREVLCNNCNTMLGFANDEPWILEEGAAYLRRHGGT